MEVQDIAQELIIIPKQVFSILLQQENAGDLIALYSFYYYTAKWQNTTEPACANSYCMKGLRMGEDRFMRAKKKLVDIGLVAQVKRKTDIDKGWYIKLLYDSTLPKEPGKHGSYNPKNPENTVLTTQRTRKTRHNSSNNITIINNSNPIIKNIKKEKPSMTRNKPTPKQLYPDVDFECEEEYKPILQEWFTYKREKKQAYTAAGRPKIYKKLVQLSGDNISIAQKIVDQSISAPWSGLFPLVEESQKKNGFQSNTAGTRNSSSKKIDYSKVKVRKMSEE
jgi:hypothetical protein